MELTRTNERQEDIVQCAHMVTSLDEVQYKFCISVDCIRKERQNIMVLLYLGPAKPPGPGFGYSRQTGTTLEGLVQKGLGSTVVCSVRTRTMLFSCIRIDARPGRHGFTYRDAGSCDEFNVTLTKAPVLIVLARGNDN